MTTYLEYHVNLSDGQKENLAKAMKTGINTPTKK